MIENDITILINRKSDLETIKQKIIDSNFQFPIYVFEYENHFKINFNSDYEEWELDTKILNCFPDYEFTTDLEKGRKEIRLELSRYQSEFSTDGWGRPLENPLNETKFLIKKTNNKKSNNKQEKFNNKVTVWFEGNEQYYYINIVNGINKSSEEKGFLLLNNFKTANDIKNTDILKDRLYKSPLEAFQYGLYKLQDFVNQDFRQYIETKKKEIKEEQKVPRKIIRDFINSCNTFQIEGILKSIDDKIIFERRNSNWETTIRIKGIQEFKEYLKLPNQELCSFNFKIRSSWSFKLPTITISVKFPQVSKDSTKETIERKIYCQITFELNNNKITNIIFANLYGT